MIAVSEVWKNAIMAQFRRQGYLQVSLEIVPPGLTGTTELTSNADSDLMQSSALLGRLDTVTEDFATFEIDYWASQGKQYILSESSSLNPPMLWMSKYPSDHGAVTFTFQFDEKVSFPGISFTWDTIHSAYPILLQVKTWTLPEGALPDDPPVVKDQLSFYNSNVTSTLSGAFDDIVRVEVTIPKSGWSRPEWRIRLQSISLGLLIQIDPNINVSAVENESISITGQSLPTANYQISVRNIVASIGGQVTLKPLDNYSSEDVFNSWQSLGKALNQDFSSFQQLVDARELVATFEINYWGSSGAWYIISPNDDLNKPLGWASTSLYFPEAPDDSNIEYFNSEWPILIGLKLANVSNVDAIEIVWDSLLGSYSDDFKIVCYDIYNYVIWERSFTEDDIDTSEGVPLLNVKPQALYVSRVEIQINSWSQQGWRARIDSIRLSSSWDFGQNFTETNDFFDPMLERGYSKYLARRQRTFWRWGFVVDDKNTVEWMPTQTRYLDGWTIPSDGITATFKCTSRLSMMNAKYYYGELPLQSSSDEAEAGISLWDLAYQIIERGSVIKESTGEMPLDIDPALQNIRTLAPAPLVQENIIFQYIAGAVGMILKCDPVTQFIQIHPEGDFTEYTIGRQVMLTDPTVNISAELKEININIYSYNLDKEDSVTDLYRGIVHFTRLHQKVILAYNTHATNVTVTANVPGLTWTSQDYLGCTVITSIVLPEGAQLPLDVTFEVKGRKITSNYTVMQTYYNDDAKNGEVVTINNPLITSAEMAMICTNATLRWFANRHHLSFKYTGAPELKAGDTAAIYSKYSNSIGLLTKSSLSFNGGWNGTLDADLHVEVNNNE